VEKDRHHIDPDTRLPHIYGHGVTEAEAESVLRHPGEDRAGRDGSLHALGQTAAGRSLLNLPTIAHPTSWRDGLNSTLCSMLIPFRCAMTR
jgi:hypothetical protein